LPQLEFIILSMSRFENRLPPLQTTRLQRLWSYLLADNRKALWEAYFLKRNPWNIGDDSGRKQLIEA